MQEFESDYFRKRIPKDERVLVFVQFDDLMKKVGEAFKDHGLQLWVTPEGELPACVEPPSTSERTPDGFVYRLGIGAERFRGLVVFLPVRHVRFAYRFLLELVSGAD